MISLKAYIREIESMIDQGQCQEAITHCKHILLKYPKYIDVYRNLGKSLLELKKHSDAADIFLRVLNVFPDDFISHAGLSIIAEEQKNIDLAIWHMELAFDVQPSNLAIQEELKRLFRLRDGNTPVKIRLTHGALIRMYARGELYQQAMSETKAILLEDPKRVDLEVLLAKMLFLSGEQKVAEKKLLEIISKMSYCFEANQLLEKIYTQRNDLEGAEVFRNRLISIDPYYQFIHYPYSDLDVPEQKLLIDKANLPSIPETNQATNQNNPFEPFVNNSDLLDPVNNSIFEASPLKINEFYEKSIDSIDSSEVLRKNLKDSDLIDSPDATLVEVQQKYNAKSFPIDQDTKSKENIVNEIPGTNLKSFFSELSEGTMNTESDDFKNNNDQTPLPSDWLSQFSDINKMESNEQNEDKHDDLPDWLHSLNSNSVAPDAESDDVPSWLKNLQSEVEPDSSSATGEFGQKAPVRNSNVDSSSNDPESVFLQDPAFNDENDIQSIAKGWEKIELEEPEKENTGQFESSSSTQDNGNTDENRIPDWVNSMLMSDVDNFDGTDIGFSQTDLKPDLEINTLKDKQNENPDLGKANLDNGLISQQTNDELLNWLRNLKTVEENAENLDSTPVSDISSETKKVDELTDFPSENNERPEEDLNEIAFKILENQKLSNQSSYSASDSQKPYEDQSLEKELEMLFSNPKTDENDATPEILDEAMNDHPSVKNEIGDNKPQNDEFLKELEQYFNNKDFAKTNETFVKLLDQGYDFDHLLECIRPQNDDLNLEHGYWLLLGDVLTKNNRFLDALTAYQKAEELIKNLLKG